MVYAKDEGVWVWFMQGMRKCVGVVYAREQEIWAWFMQMCHYEMSMHVPDHNVTLKQCNNLL